MKLWKVRGVVALAFALNLACECGYAQTPSNITYTVIDLGSLRTDGTGISDAHAINSQGDVVGVASGNDSFQHAFLWTAAGGIKNLELFGNGQFTAGGDNTAAYGISYAAAGGGNATAVRYIVGEGNPPALSTGNEHALFLGPQGLADLNGQQAFSGGPNSAASAVNTNGVTVGWAVLAGSYAYHAFRYTTPTIVDLGTLPGGSESRGVAINNLGDVAGSSTGSNALESATVWRHTGGGPVQITGMTVANGINDSGLVVGNLNATSGDGIQAVAGNLSGGSAVPLAPIAGQSSAAWGVNNRGQIVGVSGIGTVIRSPGITTGVSATLWQGSTVVDLNTRITAAGWHLATAEAINDAGQIVGSGFHNGIQRAFLLTPPPSISSPSVAPRELLPAGGPVVISAVVSNNVGADPVRATLSGAGAAVVTLTPEPNEFYTGTFTAPANTGTNAQIYAVNLQAGTGTGAAAGTITVDGLSSGILKVSSTNLVFKATKLGKKVNLVVTLKNTGPVRSSPLRIKINGPFTSLGMLSFKPMLPASSRFVVAADGSVWVTLARNKSVAITVTFQPSVTMAVSDQLIINSNATGQSPVTVKFSGTGK